MRGTPRQERRPGFRIALALGLGLLTGCAAEERAWHWDAGPQETPQAFSRSSRAAIGADPGVMVLGGTAFRADDPPEATRRDAVIGARSGEAVPDRLGWAAEPRPDWRYARSARTSRTPERFVLPDRRRDPPARNRHPHHGW